MARAPKTYKKLAGGGLSLFFRHDLYQGPDHLLWVETGAFHEQYKRFYFNDIQAIMLRRNRHRGLWALGWGACILLFGIIWLMGRGPGYGSGLMTAISALGLGIHWWRGPCCEVYLQTAVQIEKLSTLVRVPKALKVMERIRTAAEAVQGPFDGRLIPPDRGPEEAAATVISAAGIAPGPVSAAGPADGEPYQPLLHRILFSLLILFGLLRCFQLWARSFPLVVLDIIGMAGTLVLAIIVLVRWHHWVKGTVLSLASWMTLVFAALHGLSAYIMFIVTSIGHPARAFQQGALLKAFFELRLGDQPIVWGIGVAAAAISLVLGLLGWMATPARRQAQGA
jgi:hypothetical protein